MARAARRGGRGPRNQCRDAVDEVGPPVAEAHRPGLKALGRSHSRLVSCNDSNRLTGSIDLDAALRQEQPNASRWDYWIGYRHDGTEHAVWVEVHGAQTSKVREALRKLDWLKDRLNADGQLLRRMTAADGPAPVFVWLASGRLNLPPNSRQAKLASQAGIYPRRRLDLP